MIKALQNLCNLLFDPSVVPVTNKKILLLSEILNIFLSIS